MLIDYFWGYVMTIFNCSAFTDKPEHNCHFPAPVRNCMTDRQALQDFPDTSQVSFHENNKINSPDRGAETDAPETVAFRFISERTVM
jgi:hypothetical protein